MNCENIKEKLSLYIDNLLEPDEAEKIREHIENCDSCRIYYNKLLKLGEMVDSFVISENEEHWESQKDKVLDKIEQAESDKIINVQPVKKQNKYFKYLAVAASLALVAFVSIYESQEFNQVKGLFDDSEIKTAPEVPLEKISVEDITVRGDRAGETSEETDVLLDEVEIVSPDSLSDQMAIEPTSAPKKRTEKSQATPRKIKMDATLNGIGTVQRTSKPVSLELGEAVEVSNYGELQSAIIKPTSVSSHSVKVEPISFEAPRVDIQKEKVLPHEEMQKRAVESQGKSDLDYEKSVMRTASNEEKIYMAKPVEDKDSTLTEIDIYKIRLDSLEEKYEGIYSPHYRESTAKGRVGIQPDSLDMVILELAETCFKVGILSLDENERENMIGKLRRLSINGSPESIEKIQRYIVLLLSVE